MTTQLNNLSSFEISALCVGSLIIVGGFTYLRDIATYVADFMLVHLILKYLELVKSLR